MDMTPRIESATHNKSNCSLMLYFFKRTLNLHLPSITWYPKPYLQNMNCKQLEQKISDRMSHKICSLFYIVFLGVNFVTET